MKAFLRRGRGFFEIKVVDAPADVAVASAGLLVPPGVMAGALLENSRKVSRKPSASSVSSHAHSWGRKPEIFLFSFGRARSMSLWAVFTSPQITILSSPRLRKRGMMSSGTSRKSHLELGAPRGLAVWKIDIEKRDVAVLRGEDAALVVEGRDAEAALDF